MKATFWKCLLLFLFLLLFGLKTGTIPNQCTVTQTTVSSADYCTNIDGTGTDGLHQLYRELNFNSYRGSCHYRNYATGRTTGVQFRAGTMLGFSLFATLCPPSHLYNGYQVKEDGASS